MPPKTRALLEALEAELGTGAVLTGEAVSERAQGIWRPAPLRLLPSCDLKIPGKCPLY